jgi:hypothetical protein
MAFRPIVRNEFAVFFIDTDWLKWPRISYIENG